MLEPEHGATRARVTVPTCKKVRIGDVKQTSALSSNRKSFLYVSDLRNSYIALPLASPPNQAVSILLEAGL